MSNDVLAVVIDRLEREHDAFFIKIVSIGEPTDTKRRWYKLWNAANRTQPIATERQLIVDVGWYVICWNWITRFGLTMGKGLQWMHVEWSEYCDWQKLKPAATVFAQCNEVYYHCDDAPHACRQFSSFGHRNSLADIALEQMDCSLLVSVKR